MSDIKSQVHNRFKIFAGKLQADNTIGPLGDAVAAFVRENRVAAKSIGVEYLESADHLFITLGYRDDEPAYPVKLSCVSLGKPADLVTRTDFSGLERAMGEASARMQNIICHELYITEEHELMMVFMTAEL